MSKIEELYKATGELKELAAKIEKLLPQARKAASEADKRHLKQAALFFEELLHDIHDNRLPDVVHSIVGRCEKRDENTEGMKP
ncbi:hypothetical protein [Rhizobium sp. RU36D]|uniref:hypothetical protein n=1 Tax=Rhizobium sp. RU36D TaxID=1907415 RepID=UPI0009D8336F|nr:hypothetical protein [Rhizobium sp. RU36D]SMD16374.1 hypothetical protein SAMN05880593_12965 [Rhizobium sp. RU36D]